MTAEKAHATWAASSTARNWACAGALALSAKVPAQPESEAAAWGTACHAISEDCLRNGRDAVEWIGRTIKTKEHEIEVDEEMADTAQTYIDYVLGQLGRADIRTPMPETRPSCFIEQRFTLDQLKPPFDAGGTADAVIYNPNTKTLEVIDLKGGRGVVVEVENNKQLRTYGLGAMLAFPKLDIDRIRVTIVQPRAGHKDGIIRSEEFSPVDLMEWTTDLLAAMDRAKTAGDELANIKGELSREAWGKSHLRTGEHCRFCPAAAICPAQEQASLDAAGVWFDDLDKPQLRNTPDELDPERLAKVLDMADMIESWLSAVRALAHRLAETGTEIPNYQLVEKIGRRKWRDEDDVVMGLSAAGVLVEELYDRKLKSPAQVEKTLGAKRKKALEAVLTSLTEKPVTGTNLVRADKTTRPAITAGPQKHLTAIE